MNGNTDQIQAAKQVVRDMVAAVDASPAALMDHVSSDYHWRGVRPFYEQKDAPTTIANVLAPLHQSLTGFHRREHIFMAGVNLHAEDEIWTCSSGNFFGVFDHALAGISPNGKAVLLPYAEFHRVEAGKVAETALFLDLIRLQQQVGLDPIPTQTGSRLTPPGPLTNDGILLDAHDPREGDATRDLLDEMIDDLSKQNSRGTVACPPDVLRRTWHETMAWYGPAGIGTALTIPRYQEQHQTPFRTKLSDKIFNGHVCRIAEGNYSGWFGWPNLNNKNTGGYLGLPVTGDLAEMRVVDIYRRDGDKLAENWVLIDIAHYAAQHGVDLFVNPDALKDSQRITKPL